MKALSQVDERAMIRNRYTQIPKDTKRKAEKQRTKDDIKYNTLQAESQDDSFCDGQVILNKVNKKPGTNRKA